MPSKDFVSWLRNYHNAIYCDWVEYYNDTPCEEYISKFWPSVYQEFLSKV
jgi:hypothetical protein